MNRIILVFAFYVFSACTGKDTLVRPHQGQIEAPRGQAVAANTTLNVSTMSLSQAREILSSLRGHSEKIASQILIPLEKEIINLDFMTNPENIQGDFSQWLSIYTESLLQALGSTTSAQALSSLDKFVELSFRNCDESFRGCSLLKTLKLSSNSSKLLVYKANIVGKQLDRCLEDKKSCQPLVQKKYNLLIQAHNLNSSQLPDLDFTVSYIEHANLIEKLPNGSLIRSMHAQTFATSVQFFDPEKTSLEVRCKIIKNFEVWTHSRLTLGSGRQSMKKLFELTARCDLYDQNKELTSHFKESVSQIQLGADSNGGISFHQKFALLHKEKDSRALFEKFGIGGLLNKAASVGADGKTIDFSFYNEYFFVLDRLYSGHIGLEDAQQILLLANRSYSQLLTTFENYIKMQMVANVAFTKEYLRGVFAEGQDTVASDKIFERAVENSESFAQTWRTLTTNIQNLEVATGVIFKKQNLVNENDFKKFRELNKQIRNLPSTIKYIATYPTMMSMAHYLAQQEATRSARTWWGGTISFSSSTIYENLWKGTERPWFQFSDDQGLNKFYLLYAFDYAVRADFVSVQSQQGKELSHNERLKDYMQTLISRYLKNERDAIFNSYEEKMVKKTDAHPMASRQKILCDYELNPNNNQVFQLNKNVEDLRVQLHSGQGRSSSTNYSEPSREFFGNAGEILNKINSGIYPKLLIIKSLIAISRKNNLPAEVIEAAEKEVAATEEIVHKIVENFSSKIVYHSNCLRRLYLVENYYQYLGYESERQYLGQVWDDMNSLQALEGAALNKALIDLNNSPNRYRDDNQDIKTVGNNANLLFYDRITSKRVFTYSTYDILFRLKNLLTTGNIEKFADARLVKITNDWKKSFPGAMTKPIQIPRLWDIDTPSVLDQSELVRFRSNDVDLDWSSDREEFIRQGLSVLKGNAPKATVEAKVHIDWFFGNNNDLDVWKKSIDILVSLYMAQNKDDKFNNKITPKHLLDGMKSIISMVSMNELDVQLVKTFSETSKISLEGQQAGVLVDTGLRETMHPYTYLYENFKTKMDLNTALLDLSPNELIRRSTLIADAYLLSLNLNDSEYRIYFSNHKWLESELRAQYEKVSHNYLTKITDLSEAFDTNRNSEDSEIIFKLENGLPKRLSDSSKVSLGDDLIHPQGLKDMRAFVEKFTQKSKNIYNTEFIGKKRP